MNLFYDLYKVIKKNVAITVPTKAHCIIRLTQKSQKSLFIPF